MITSVRISVMVCAVSASSGWFIAMMPPNAEVESQAKALR